MHLMIAALVHFDVCGRDRLAEWLRDARNSNQLTPRFVAVEYDRAVFEKIRAQRSLLRARAAELWPACSLETLDTLAGSLVYDGDCHMSVFPGVETLWLDEGRFLEDPTVIEEYARDRLALYRGYASGLTEDLGVKALHQMSERAWADGPPPIDGGDQRDCIFADRILSVKPGTPDCWGVCIVGANHASDVRGSMVSRLRDAGVACHVTQLRPLPR